MAHVVEQEETLNVFVAGFSLNECRNGVTTERIRLPVPSRDPLDFASVCWISRGSTALMQRDVCDRVGPADESLRRLEDLDWYLRLALLGGGVVWWPELTACCSRGTWPAVPTIDDATNRILAKYRQVLRLDSRRGQLMRRLRAYLCLERASAAIAVRRCASAVWLLFRSWLLVPCVWLHMERFWYKNMTRPWSAVH
jgi:GT2 family glycosyltransferase